MLNDTEIKENPFESEEFYNLMQDYRHASQTNQEHVKAAFNAVKTYAHSRQSEEMKEEKELLTATLPHLRYVDETDLIERIEQFLNRKS